MKYNNSQNNSTKYPSDNRKYPPNNNTTFSKANF